MNSEKLHEISIIDRQLFIDDTKINGIRSIGVDIDAVSVPEVTIGILPNELDVEIAAKLDIRPELRDIYDAIKCIRIYMQLDSEFKRAVVASTKSAIDDIRNKNQTDVIDDYALAKAIVERIFIGER